jgi:hypothetical protein
MMFQSICPTVQSIITGFFFQDASLNSMQFYLYVMKSCHPFEISRQQAAGLAACLPTPIVLANLTDWSFENWT